MHACVYSGRRVRVFFHYLFPFCVCTLHFLVIVLDKWYHVVVGRNRTHGYVQLEGRRVIKQAESRMVSLDTTTLLYVGE